jgi:hypothetical protein
MQDSACEIRRIHVPRTRMKNLLGPAGFLHISRPRDEVKLLHHAEVVPHRPVLHDSPIGDTHDIDEPHRHPSAGRGMPMNSP